MKKTREVWRPVVGYEGIYTVSSLGRVCRQRRASGAAPGYLLTPKKGSHEYDRVTLCDKGNISTKYVHRLVLQAFTDIVDEKEQVNHRNGNKRDNRLENLEWVTRSENRKHAFRVLGEKPPCVKGEKHGRAKLTEKKVLEIRKRLLRGERGLHLSREFGVTHGVIYDIRSRKTWRHI